MTKPFFTRHPYFKSLLKLTGYIVVSYNALAACMLAPFIFLIIIGITMSSVPANALTNLQPVYGSGSNQLLSVKITGTIVGDADDNASPLGSLTGQTSGYAVKRQLMEAAKDPGINGVILEINSPGGTIYGAHAIADGVKYYREQTQNPVYTHISGMAASGAYWAAVSTDKIIADYGSDAGSIGVIMGPFEYYNKVISQDSGLLGGGVVTQNGIEQTTITAGKSKDVGNPYRRLTPEEVQVLQRQVNNDYELFVKYVSDQRKIPVATIKDQIGAMSYDNQTALQYKLIDETASREDAYRELADAAGVSGNYQIMRKDSPKGLMYSLLNAASSKPQRQAATGGPCRLSQVRLAYSGDLSQLCQ